MKIIISESQRSQVALSLQRRAQLLRELAVTTQCWSPSERAVARATAVELDALAEQISVASAIKVVP